MVCCALMSCAKLVGIRDYHDVDGGTVTGDAGSDAAVTAVPCSVGLSQGGHCPRSLAVGVNDTCVIAPDGLYCWGRDVPGFSTDVQQPESVTPLVPTEVESSTSLDGFGSLHGTTCYFGSDLRCWGNTEVAQLLTLQPTLLPEMPLTLAFMPIDSFVVGGDHMIAISAGSGACWGATSLNQCNVGPVGSVDCNDLGTTCDVNTVSLELVIGNVTVAGAAHTCTTPDASNGVTCWGDNTYGQLGSTPALPEVQVEDGIPLGSASALALGAKHTCAIVGADTYCWGANDAGQLGIEGGPTTKFATPVTVQSGTQFAAIAAGSDTTCAIDMAKNVWCWGADTQGAAGQPSSGGSFPEVMIPMMTTVTDAIAIGVGFEHACAILASGAIECWGDNEYGELGDGSSAHQVTGCVGDCSWEPVTVKGP